MPRPTSDVDGDEAPGAAGEAVDLAQAEARALADLLGGEERLEHARQRLGRDAAAGVGRPRPRRRRPAARPCRPPPRCRGGRCGCAPRSGRAAVRLHRVAGVDDEVEDGGLELGRVDADRVERRVEVEGELDRAARRRARPAAGSRASRRFGLRVCGPQHLPAREGEELLRQLLAAPRRRHRGLGQALDPLASARACAAPCRGRRR